MFPSIFGGSQAQTRENSVDSLPLSPTPSNMSSLTVNATGKHNLAREKNRLTLRAYLHNLLNSPVIASSPVLRSFLMDGPIRLNQEEKTDILRREDADHVREEGKKRFDKEVKDRVEKLQQSMGHFKSDVVGKG
jgi:flagellar basal body-associated protein FliL